ncbi:hypothetical protein EJ06DRAFT_252926 [Trichodelitschia bisporula]|uniref:Uncharacterized protein n=1 Tax=Trichodelitschia bisporula TaxID=703511 RepID=A0A6G1HIV3_9PEZI|nr:hypothetical protein EJ06DRAFT_252926 [Trichodelitschia bisporula]
MHRNGMIKDTNPAAPPPSTSNSPIPSPTPANLLIKSRVEKWKERNDGVHVNMHRKMVLTAINARLNASVLGFPSFYISQRGSKHIFLAVNADVPFDFIHLSRLILYREKTYSRSFSATLCNLLVCMAATIESTPGGWGTVSGLVTNSHDYLFSAMNSRKKAMVYNLLRWKTDKELIIRCIDMILIHGVGTRTPNGQMSAEAIPPPNSHLLTYEQYRWLTNNRGPEPWEDDPFWNEPIRVVRDASGSVTWAFESERQAARQPEANGR